MTMIFHIIHNERSSFYYLLFIYNLLFLSVQLMIMDLKTFNSKILFNNAHYIAEEKKIFQG